MNTQRAYEHQVSDLTKSLASLEGEIRRMEEERHGNLQDMAAVRDLCTRLEASKDQLQRQLTAKLLDYEKVSVLLLFVVAFLSVSFSILLPFCSQMHNKNT